MFDPYSGPQTNNQSQVFAVAGNPEEWHSSSPITTFQGESSVVSREPKKSRSGGSLSSSLSPYSQAKKRRVRVYACVCARCGFRECRKEDGEKQHGAAAAAAGSGERVREEEDKECAAKRERRVVVEKADRSCRGGWRRASSNCVGNEERQRRRRQQRRHPLRVCTHSRA